MSSVIDIQPWHFVHVLDLNTNIEHVARGPQSLLLQCNEKLLAGPLPFVVVPPGSYCIICNPCRDYAAGEPVKLQHGRFDVRFHKEPFLLYPGEELVDCPEFGAKSSNYKKAIKPLPIIGAKSAVRLEARVDYTEAGGVARKAGDRWQLEGPLSYRPVAEAEIVSVVQPHVIRYNQALRLRAARDCVDRTGRSHVTGEEWLVDKEGAYLPGVFEEVVKVEQAVTLTDNIALHVRATQQLVGMLGKDRHTGDEWLVTSEETQSFLPPIGVTVLKTVKRTILSRNQYCVVMNPVGEDGSPQLGKRKLHTGITSFFLKPGEELEKGVQPAHILSDKESLVLQADILFRDISVVTGKTVVRRPGDKWMIHGPAEYLPPVQVQVISTRKAIPLSKNEGVYVQDVQSGVVRAVMGPQAYMLTANEELFKKTLTQEVETLLKKGGGMGTAGIRKLAYFEQSIDPVLLTKGRDKTRVVTFRCPGNTACQVYNYKKKTARVIFGPDLVILGPHENFNVLSLSAGKPKKPDALQSLCLMLGPDFITDIIEVETSDHARLQIKMAFNNYFDVDKTDTESAQRCFAVSDFIGYACRQVASKIRGTVAQVAFDEFHRHSNQIITHAVFGVGEQDRLCTQLTFPANNLVITNVDIQSIEPTDIKMRNSLQKSVQNAIEIATRSIEAAATHEAKRLEQVSRGQLEKQKLENEKEYEKRRAVLLKLRAITAAVESTGQAVAEAQAQAEKSKIECESEIEVARLRAQATGIEHTAELNIIQKRRLADIDYQQNKNHLEIDRLRKLANIEVTKLSKMVSAIGVATLQAIATSGPQAQEKLSRSIGIDFSMFTGDQSVANLFGNSKSLLALQ